ncbi:deoxyribodipyrimidine photo-lyase [bacterium]|nr:deoxyribodipyrimidine photo-lyase [bacterium]
MSDAPLILWFRRDLRLSDHPMLTEALALGRPVIPVFVLDPETEAIGAAARWRLGLSLADFAARLEAMGSRLILRRGPLPEVLDRLLTETGAGGVLWSRCYDPATQPRDAAVKAGLRARGLVAQSVPGFLLHEPWTVKTGQDGFYRVYTPFWNAVRDRDIARPLPAPQRLPAPAAWPASDRLADWRMGAEMRRGAAILLPHARVGEAAAQARLADFIATRVAVYKLRRDFLAEEACSGLSENLTYGEISPRQIWHEGMRAMQAGAAGAEHFLKELVWREFAWHLLHHTPHIATGNWRPEWDSFPWRPDSEDAEAWRRGMTGEPIVDAAMRQIYVTGTMHNRARMIVASYLTKHLMTHWKIGLDWFADCLTDWDPASNAMGWQWVAGSGPDAAPYFRIFNPATQAKTFDPDGLYQRRYLAELSQKPGKTALDYFAAVPLSWGLAPDQRYPLPRIPLQDGRNRALAAYAQRSA